GEKIDVYCAELIDDLRQVPLKTCLGGRFRPIPGLRVSATEDKVAALAISFENEVQEAQIRCYYDRGDFYSFTREKLRYANRARDRQKKGRRKEEGIEEGTLNKWTQFGAAPNEALSAAYGHLGDLGRNGGIR